MTADDTWTALAAALDEHAPACAGEPAFTADDETLTDVDRALMAWICGSCPLLQPCSTYAAATKPDGGFWAGAAWTRRGPRHQPRRRSAAVDNSPTTP